MARRRTDNGIGEGHNSTGMIDATALKGYIDRVVALMEERKSLNEDISEVYEEAKDAGFVTKHLRQLAREAMMDPEERQQHLDAMDALRHALGDYVHTPLGEAAERRADRASN